VKPSVVVLAAIAVLIAGCQRCRELGGGTGLDLPWLAVVYECACERDAESFLVELCYDGDGDELEAAIVRYEPRVVSATCYPTPRHLGPCRMICPPDGGRGCNARSGCYCNG
jgi:hypothetical protein